MREYTESELLLLILSMFPDEAGHTEKALCKKLLRYHLLDTDATLSLEAMSPFMKSGEQYRQVEARLLQRTAMLDHLMFLAGAHIQVLTILSPEYPEIIRDKMGSRAPLLLFCSGNTALFQKKCISLVGSRKLTEIGIQFSREAGRQIARQGYVYCSGGAIGADSEGFFQAVQNGQAIIFTPDSLKEAADSEKYREPLEKQKLLLVSEDGYDLHFTSARALSRNHLIHAMGQKTFVAQTDVGKGGTWSGTVDNLKHHYSPVFVCSDQADSSGMNALISRGAFPVALSELRNLSGLREPQLSLNI